MLESINQILTRNNIDQLMKREVMKDNFTDIRAVIMRILQIQTPARQEILQHLDNMIQDKVYPEHIRGDNGKLNIESNFKLEYNILEKDILNSLGILKKLKNPYRNNQYAYDRQYQTIMYKVGNTLKSLK